MGVVIEFPLRGRGQQKAFPSAEEACFWMMRAITARHNGASVSPADRMEGIEPDDVAKALDRLYRQRRIELAHARVLRIYCERGIAPNPSHPSERDDARLWTEVMHHMNDALRRRGIVK